MFYHVALRLNLYKIVQLVKSKVDCVLLTLQLSLCKFLECKTFVKTSS